MSGRHLLIIGGAAKPRIALSNTSLLDTSDTGFDIGTLSVRKGEGSYIFSLDSDPSGFFAIDGDVFEVANMALAAGTYPVVISASGSPQPGPRTFNIEVIAPPAAGDTFLDFSVGGVTGINLGMI